MKRALTVLAVLLSAGGNGPAATTHDQIEYWRTLPSVKEFTKTRGFFPRLLEIVAGPGDGKPELTRPFAVTQDSTGRVLIADPGQRGVHLFDLEKHKYLFLRGSKKNQMASPVDVACDSNDDIYVSDSVKRQVFVFDSRGRYLRSLQGTGANQLQRPTGMALDRAGRLLYLADTMRHQVLVYRLDGANRGAAAPVRIIGQRGTGKGEFNYPTSLALASGKLYVVDTMNFRVQTFTAQGEWLGAFGQPGTTSGTFNRPKGIAVDTEGNLYVPDALFETVQIFSPAGQLLYYFGATGTQPGQFQMPAGISIDSRNVVYVADSMNQRVQVFHYRRQTP
jgi:sugar lactone lactonase YvrE